MPDVHVHFILRTMGFLCMYSAVDTYGYRPLHRMASNNLAVGAEALLAAGANPNPKAIGMYVCTLVSLFVGLLACWFD